MPKQENNIVMKSTRGMFGKQVVFKEKAGEAYVSAPPKVDKNRKPTDSQSVVRKKFRISTAYANAVVKNADLKKEYAAKAKRGRSAHNVALQDAFNAPEILGIIRQGYQGRIGDIIVVQALDDFRVTGVQVAIYTMDNELVEQGAAVLDANGLNWIYTATEDHIALEGSTIKATAKDLPGNEGSLEVIL